MPRPQTADDAQRPKSLADQETTWADSSSSRTLTDDPWLWQEIRRVFCRGLTPPRSRLARRPLAADLVVGTPSPSHQALLPALPPHDIVKGTAACPQLRPRALTGRRMADGDCSDGPVALRNTEGVHQGLLTLEYPEEQGA